MNERIKQLAEQAKKYALDTIIEFTDPEQTLKVYSESYDTKFAELIVRECADIFEGVYTDQQRPERIDKRIKEHFGVKE